MKKILSLLALAFSCITFAQENTGIPLKGRVIDQDTGETIPGMHVKVKKSKTGDKSADRTNRKTYRKTAVLSNLYGQFTLNNLQPGDVIILMRDDYHTKKIIITAPADSMIIRMKWIKLYKDDITEI